MHCYIADFHAFLTLERTSNKRRTIRKVMGAGGGGRWVIL